ncbi:MAG: enoyl-CoA hydratase-related protein [Pseudomonadota bacterium]
MASYETLIIDRPADAVAQVTLNRPDSLNAFNVAQRRDLAGAMRDLAADPAVRAVVLTGAGRGFSAGADLKDPTGGDPAQVEHSLNTEYGAFLQIMATMEKPVIAAVNGPAAGIGMSTALACDLMVMGEDAYLMSAFANISLVPDGGLSAVLVQRLGYARAYEVAVEAQKLSAKKCLEWGLANRVVPTENVVEEAVQWASSLAERAPLALGLTKRVFRKAQHLDQQQTIALEAELQTRCIGSDDFRIGVEAVLTKTKAAFTGR